MEKPRSVQSSLTVELHCGGEAIGRERNEEGLVGAAKHTGWCAFRAICGLTPLSSHAIPFWKFWLQLSLQVISFEENDCICGLTMTIIHSALFGKTPILFHCFSSTFIILIVAYENTTTIETSLGIFCVNDRKSHASSLNNKRHWLAPTPRKPRDHQTGLTIPSVLPASSQGHHFLHRVTATVLSITLTLLFKRRGLCRDFALMSHCPRLGYMPIHEVGLTGVIIAEEGRWLSPLTETVRLQTHSCSPKKECGMDAAVQSESGFSTGCIQIYVCGVMPYRRQCSNLFWFLRIHRFRKGSHKLALHKPPHSLSPWPPLHAFIFPGSELLQAFSEQLHYLKCHFHASRYENNKETWDTQGNSWNRNKP